MCHVDPKHYWKTFFLFYIRYLNKFCIILSCIIEENDMFIRCHMKTFLFCFRYMWMSPESFKYLLNVVGPVIAKKDTRFRKAIPPAERLCLTLHYLAYRGSQQSLSFAYQIAKSTISNVINETCLALRNCLKGNCLRPPKASEDWKRIAKDFLTYGIYHTASEQ